MVDESRSSVLGGGVDDGGGTRGKSVGDGRKKKMIKLLVKEGVNVKILVVDKVAEKVETLVLMEEGSIEVNILKC